MDLERKDKISGLGLWNRAVRIRFVCYSCMRIHFIITSPKNKVMFDFSHNSSKNSLMDFLSFVLPFLTLSLEKLQEIMRNLG